MRWKLLFLVVLLTLVVTCSSHSTVKLTCSADRQKTVVEPTANVVLGGIFEIRQEGQSGFGCGKPATDMMQVFEATRFTVNYLNNMNSAQGYVSGITFGMRAYDTCSSSSQAVNALQKLYPQTTSSNPYCTTSTTKIIPGVVGPLFSSTAVSVAEYAKNLPVSVISPVAMTPVLSDKFKYPTFLRTIPSSAVFSKVVIEALQKLNWHKFKIVYVDDAYGRSLYEHLLQAAHQRGLCVSQVLVLDTSNDKENYKRALATIGMDSFVPVVISAAAGNARVILQAADEVPSVSKFEWIPTDFDISRDYSTLKRARGIHIIHPKTTLVQEFRDYFTQREADPRNNNGNPWFEDWFKEVYGCSFTGGATPCTPLTQAQYSARFIQNPWVVLAIKSVFAYAEVVRQVCAGSGVGFCPQLRDMSATDFHDRLKRLDFTFPASFPIAALRGHKIKFDSNGDPEVPEFTVYNYNNRNGGAYMFEAVAEYTSGVLSVNIPSTFYTPSRDAISSTAPAATCQMVGCDNCMLPQRAVNFRYSPGDVVIASLVDAHQGSGTAFTCGDSLPTRLASLVAAEWAVSKAKSSGKLGQVGLGSLVADMCSDRFVAQGFLTDLLSGNNLLVDPSGMIVSPKNIRAFVDMTEIDQAKVISPLLTNYMIPEVQVSAADTKAAMSAVTPYFASAIPSNDVYYTALASLLQRLGFKYVQVATGKSVRSHEMAKLFTQKSAAMGICVVNRVHEFDGTTGGYDMAVTRLLGTSMSRVVVVIGDKKDVRGLLTAIKAKGATGMLRLVSGTERWDRDPSIVQGLEDVAAGSIILDLQMTADAEFNNYLSTRSLTEIAAHPFQRKLFEVTNQCSLDISTRGLYARSCNTNDKFNIYQGKAPYVIQSINTVADKLAEVIKELCQVTQINVLCPDFQSGGDIGSRLATKLQNVAKMANGYGIRNGESTTDFVFYVYRTGSYTQFASFNTDNKQLGSVDINQLGQLQTPVCDGVCVECQYMFGLQPGISTPGDFLIAGAFSVSDPNIPALQPYICGEVRTSNGPQFTMAMMYALEQVNSGKAPVSAKGIKFGGIGMDHCNTDGRAKLLVSNVFSGLLNDMSVDQSKVLAMLTDNTGSTIEAAQLLDPIDVAIVSPSATSPSLLEYPNFMRTIQGDTTVVTGLVKIVKALGFRYIQVLHSPGKYGRDGLATIQAVGMSHGVCIINSVELSDRAKVSDAVATLLASDTRVIVTFMGTSDTQAFMTAVANNPVARTAFLIIMPDSFPRIVAQVAGQLTYPVLSLQLRKSTLPGYEAYINSGPISNPYFAQYYMKLKQCSLPGYSLYNTPCPNPLPPITQDPAYFEDSFVLSTINAVYSVVDALDRTIREYCGVAYTVPCAGFMAATDRRERFNRNLNATNFVDESGTNFRFLSREGNVAFDIMQSTSTGSYRKVGGYAGVSLDMNDASLQAYPSVKSECTSPCLQCVMRGLNFSHTPGDIYIGGVFDVHQRFLSPFTCGKIQKLHGFLLLEAFHYALNQVNSKQGQFANILRGVRLGGVGLDACGSQVRGGHLLSNIHNRLITLARDNVVIAPSKIDAYVGSYSSGASVYLARILTDLKIPQISYAASSDELSDDRVFPYFYRTVPSDDKTVEAMLKFLDKMKIRYVQVLFENNVKGITARDAFVAMAASYRICVAQTVSYPDLAVVSQEISNAVVTRLIEKPAANTVVTFLATGYVNSLLKAIGRSDRARNKLRFVGSDEWSDNQDAIMGAEIQALDSITLKLDFDDVEDFERYLSTKTLSNSAENPWFEEYYQEILNCYISKTNQLDYPRPCPSIAPFIINSPGYQQDPGVVHVINAVYAAAYGIHETLKEKCGADYSSVCHSYTISMDRHNMLRDKLAAVNFKDPVGNQFMFVNRSGVANYRFSSINTGPLGGVIYQQVGFYNVTADMISVDKSYVSNWNSDCNRDDACSECPAIRDRGVRHVFYKPTVTYPTTIVAFFDIHKQGVDPYRCGEINMQGFQHFVSFFYSLDRLLKNFVMDGSRGIRVLVVDTCSNSLRVDQDLFGLLQGTGLCNTDFDNRNPISIDNLGSVITLGDLNTAAASRVLEAPGVSYVSPNALSTLLDDKMHLARTISPISAKMHFIATFLSKVGWVYVDVIYENSPSGVYPLEKFNHFANDMRVCRGQAMGSSLTAQSDAEIVDQLTKLNGKRGAQVVVLLGSVEYVGRVFKAAHSLGAISRYVWLLGVEWDFGDTFIKTYIPVNTEVHIITIERLTDKVASFDQYMSDLTYAAVHSSNSSFSIPVEWYDEYYQTKFDCTLKDSTKPINVGKQECSANQGMTNDWKQDKYVLNTVAAAYAVTKGLSQYLKNCTTTPCPSFNKMEARMSINNAILDTVWPMQSVVQGATDFRLDQNVDLTLQFDKMYRWWDSGYKITHWHFTKTGQRVIAEFNGKFDAQNIQKMKANFNTSSTCIESMANGACGCTFEVSEAVFKPKAMVSDHRNYYFYDNDGNRQYVWPIWAIVVAILTSLGLLITIILFLILIIAYPKRGGTTVLGYMIIIGIMGIYAINYAFFVNANEGTCGSRRFLMGVVYMITLAPMLIKAIDNWRFSHVEVAEERYSGISSALVLFLSACGLVLVQCIIPIIWLILVHPTASYWPVGYGQHDNYWCDPRSDYDVGLVLSFIFVMFILIITGIFSALGYDTTRNNNESRWTLYGCVVTAGCFTVWMIVSTIAGPTVRDPAVAIGNLVNATLLMMMLPFRKMVLMCRARREKEEKDNAMEVNGTGPYDDGYSNSYANNAFELGDYDNDYVDAKPSEF